MGNEAFLALLAVPRMSNLGAVNVVISTPGFNHEVNPVLVLVLVVIQSAALTRPESRSSATAAPIPP